ncbi:transmembrane emp24 domain-containing protein p24beta2-like protein [Tanacetum coccineum]
MVSTVVVATILVLLTDIIGEVFGIRFTINRRECLSHKAEYGATVRFSFVVINVEDHDDFHYTLYGTDLVVKGPNGELIQEFRDKTSENSEFVAHNEGLYQFCFSNQSPYQETLDFDVHSSHFYRDVEHAKDDHLKPVMEQIKILEEALWRIKFEQSWLESKADRHAIINEKISKRAVHKALVESLAMVGASVLQVYLLTRLFKRKLGMSSV